MNSKRILQTLMIAIVSIGLFNASALAADDGFVSIFDGKTLDNWDGHPDLWRVEDGAITGETTEDAPIKYNHFIIWRGGDVDDFELKFQFRVPRGNSGCQYRSFEVPKVGPWSVGGYQADFEAGEQWNGILYGEQYRGILAKRGEMTVIGSDHKPETVRVFGDAARLGKVVKQGEWNDYHIIARGYHFIHKINGRIMCEAIDMDHEMRLRSGILAFQLHAGPPMKLQVRDIRLKRLPMKDKKKIVLIAGKESHGYGAHEHKAGSMLLADLLNRHHPGIHATVYTGGWPSDPTLFDYADAVVMYCDGGQGHMVNDHLEQVDKFAKKGMGVACLHYGVEVPKGKSGDKFLEWIGGYFETHWSVNPHWTAEFKTIPDHPITRGVKPFTINDEWYFNMRFVPEMKGVTELLTAIPPDHVYERPDGPHSNNEHVRKLKGQPTCVAWAYERPGKGRGFGLTGGHYQWNWGHDQLRKLVLNALAWVAEAEIPENGIETGKLTVEDLMANQDYDVPGDFKKEEIARQLNEWNN